jgi:integrase
MKKQAAQRSRGQIICRGDDRYLIRLFLGRRPDGSRNYRSKTVRGTYKIADRELTKLLREIDTGTYVEPVKQSLQSYLEQWLVTTMSLKVSPRTLEDYESRLVRDIYPTIGHKRLDVLSRQDIQEVNAGLVRRGLAPRTVRYTHSVLKQALKQAVINGLLFRNPADHVTLPKQSRKEMSALSPDQVNRFLAATQGSEWYALWAVLILAGLRPGEALGLKWADLEGSTIRIVRALKKGSDDTYYLAEPKTERSRRSVLLPKQVLNALQEHRATQARRILKAGPRFERNDLIFPNSLGQPMDISKVRRLFKSALSAAGLPEVRLYDLRHTHATLLLVLGENPKVVSERLGHSNISITLDTYSHVLPTMQEASVQRLETLLIATAR